MEKIWLKRMPKGVPAEIDTEAYASVVDVFEQAFGKFRGKTAFLNMGSSMSFNELDRLSRDFAAYLQKVVNLKAGDRIAIQMPNLLQYPVALVGCLRAGLVVVNTNPLYTPREMEHQFNDAGIKAIVIVANFAYNLQKVLPKVPTLETVIVTEVGDLLGFPKAFVVNAVAKHVKKMVPPYDIPNVVPFKRALLQGAARSLEPVKTKPDELAILQYTGGTTGVSKGAMLTHRNLIANMQQISAILAPFLKDGEEIIVTPLPLYHVFSFTVNCLTFIKHGGCNLLITNPRDMAGFVKELSKYKFTVMTGVNTLFNGLLNNEEFRRLDFSTLKFVVGGAMAVQRTVSERWREITGTRLIEGFGLTEASPCLAVNPLDGTEKIGTIGLPLPSTDIRIAGENGEEMPQGERGELWAKGPQIMAGYWKKPDETAKTITKDGWLKTGDVAIFDEEGFLKIVDRMKDMILVSGFNVYPNEIEDVVASHPGVLEVAAIGMPDENAGEVVKIFVVKKDPELTAEALREFCKERFTGYKRPKLIEFRDELPKSNVGKILRRALRDEPAKTKSI